MKHTELKIKINDLVNDYKDNSKTEEGITGYSGKLNIRPKYQREFIYNDKQQKLVIDSIMHSYPLSIFQWVKHNDDEFEILDGQQRTISICKFFTGEFETKLPNGNSKFYNNFTSDEKEHFLNYELTINICQGIESELLEWFDRINIAGQPLTPQELLNSVYTGTWLSDAKRYFSKSDCPAYQLANKYLKGAPIRQDYLELALKWASNGNAQGYMAKHQHDKNASELWQYFKQVINWIDLLFPEYRKDLKSLSGDWGILYNQYHNNYYDSQELETNYCNLLNDNELTCKVKGIYQYLITKNEKHLSLRLFDNKQKLIAYNNQNGICTHCNKEFDIDSMEADHILAWSKGGKTTQENCQVLCKTCNATKSNN